MSPDWNRLSNSTQIVLAHETMRRAAETFARQAEMLAGEIEEGALADQGGPEALRLLAAVARLTARADLAVAGTA